MLNLTVCWYWVIQIAAWQLSLQSDVKYLLFIWKREIDVSICVLEEINRRIVDHTADINLTYSTIARDYLLSEGITDLVIKTGSPMFEVLNLLHV